MKQRLLVFFDQIRVPQTVTGENGRLIGFTRPFPDRADQCCLEVTCAEWAELQRYRWASSVLENGYLIPDVDFVAKDGAVFQDAAECVAHERALDVPAWKRALEDKRSGVPADLCGNHERVGWLEIDLIKIGSEETLLAILNGYEHIICHELRDFETRLVLFGTHPAFEFVQVPESEAVDFYALPKYEVLDGAIKSQCGQEVSRLAHTQKIEGSIPSTATTDQASPDISIVEIALDEIQPGGKLVLKHLNPDGIEKALLLAKERGLKATLEGDDVIVVDLRPKPNPTLESKLLTALANGPLKSKPLAELTGSTVDEMKACVKVSAFLVWTGAYLAIKPQTVQ